MAFKYVLLAALVAIAHAGNPQYSFGYGVSDPLTGDVKSQVESRSGDFVQGQYSLLDSDGTRRVVDYAADGINGFNAVVRKEAAAVAIAAPAVAPVLRAAPAIAAAPVLRAAPAIAAAPALATTVVRHAAPAIAAAPVLRAAPAFAAAPAVATTSYLHAAPAIAASSYLRAAPAIATTSYLRAAPSVAAAPLFRSTPALVHGAAYATPIAARYAAPVAAW